MNINDDNDDPRGSAGSNSSNLRGSVMHFAVKRALHRLDALDDMKNCWNVSSRKSAITQKSMDKNYCGRRDGRTGKK